MQIGLRIIPKMKTVYHCIFPTPNYPGRHWRASQGRATLGQGIFCSKQQVLYGYKTVTVTANTHPKTRSCLGHDALELGYKPQPFSCLVKAELNILVLLFCKRMERPEWCSQTSLEFLVAAHTWRWKDKQGYILTRLEETGVLDPLLGETGVPYPLLDETGVPPRLVLNET